MLSDDTSAADIAKRDAEDKAKKAKTKAMIFFMKIIYHENNRSDRIICFARP